MANKAYYIIRPANRDLTAEERAAIHAYSQENNISVRVVKEAPKDSRIITDKDLFKKKDTASPVEKEDAVKTEDIVKPKRQRKTVKEVG